MSARRTVIASEEEDPPQLPAKTEQESAGESSLSAPSPLPPPQYPSSEASTSRPPPFSSVCDSLENPSEPAHDPRSAITVAVAGISPAAPSYASLASGFSAEQSVPTSFDQPFSETKRALPRDTKGGSSGKEDNAEPPPAYSEGPSPLQSFAFLMATAGGASSIITQVQQGGPPINAIGGEFLLDQDESVHTNVMADVGADETIAMDLR